MSTRVPSEGDERTREGAGAGEGGLITRIFVFWRMGRDEEVGEQAARQEHSRVDIQRYMKFSFRNFRQLR